jgi:predicted anti-sigma-YlaC factor YlaD
VLKYHAGVSQSLQMLQRHRELYDKMGSLMHDYANSLRKKDTTPAELTPDSSFLLSQEGRFLRIFYCKLLFTEAKLVATNFDIS